MGLTTLVSCEEYLHTSYDPDVDYVDGELEDRNVGENDHSSLQAALIVHFHARRKELGIRVFPEQRVQVSPTRYRVPDICVTLGKPDEQVFTKPPFLCVEILSLEDRAGRMQRKISDYLQAGVPCVWVIDPRTRDAFIYTSSGMRSVQDGILRTQDPEIQVPLEALFED